MASSYNALYIVYILSVALAGAGAGAGAAFPFPVERQLLTDSSWPFWWLIAGHTLASF